MWSNLGADLNFVEQKNAKFKIQQLIQLAVYIFKCVIIGLLVISLLKFSVP